MNGRQAPANAANFAPAIGPVGSYTDGKSSSGQVEPSDSREAPMIWPSGASSTTATSWPSGNRSLIWSGAPDHCPTERNDLTMFASSNVRPPFLSAADRCRMVMVKADEKDLAGAAAGADLDGNLPPVALRDAHGRGSATFAFRRFDR